MGDAERKRDERQEEMNALLDDLDELLLDDLDELLSSDFIKEASQRGFICETSEITSIDESAAAPNSHRFREEQRELQPGSEIEVPTSVTSDAIKITKLECPKDGWKVWEPPGTTLEAGAHRMLACWT
jgi:hypothetical protein